MNTHKKIPYDIMMVQLKQMSKEELQRHLQLLGCDWSYEAIYESLKKTFNDLQVADAIFDSCIIQDDNSPYPKDFIDEVAIMVILLNNNVDWKLLNMLKKMVYILLKMIIMVN